MIETNALIIGAGPVGLYQVFQLGLLEIGAQVVDALPYLGGQCAALYPDKPLYDIPGLTATTGRDLISALQTQIRPFTQPTSERPATQFHLQQQVSHLARQADGRFVVRTTAGTAFLAKTVFLAAGAGAFVSRKLRVSGAQVFEGTQIFYRPPEDSVMRGKQVVIQGEDDAALQLAVDIAKRIAASKQLGNDAPFSGSRSVTLLHRRDVFSAEPSLVAQMRSLCDQGAMRFVAGQITGWGDDSSATPSTPSTPLSPTSPTVAPHTSPFTKLRLATPEGEQISLPADLLIALLGLSPQLGPLADWGLALERKQVPVDTEKFQTHIPGLFAVGDINTYPGKKKLIVCGFHECVLAAFAAADIVFPEKAQPLQYTTTSTRLHELLGVSKR